MRLAFQFIFGLLGLSSLYVGVLNFYFGSEVLQQFFQLNISELSNNSKNIIDIQIRILSGFWIAGGLYALLILKRFEESTNILRLVFIGFGVSALGELYSVILQNGDLSTGIVKAAMQIGFCVFMEYWRNYIVTKLPSKVGENA